jgi:hypothetical protein
LILDERANNCHIPIKVLDCTTVKISPKIVKTNIINDDGKMVDKKYSVYGRKIPLKQILEEMTE